jgi:hypothetical protein
MDTIKTARGRSLPSAAAGAALAILLVGTTVLAVDEGAASTAAFLEQHRLIEHRDDIGASVTVDPGMVATWLARQRLLEGDGGVTVSAAPDPAMVADWLSQHRDIESGEAEADRA